MGSGGGSGVGAGVGLGVGLIYKYVEQNKYFGFLWCKTHVEAIWNRMNYLGVGFGVGLGVGDGVGGVGRGVIGT